MNLKLALEIFEIESLARQSESDLKKIYYQKASIFHPDKGGDNNLFIKLKEAYSLLRKILKNPEQEHEHTEIDYKQAYQDLQKITKIYENIFSSQVEIINNNASQLNNLVANYNYNQEIASQNLENNLEKLQKLHTQNWLQYALNIKNISEQEYLISHNQLIDKYNQEFEIAKQEFDRTFLELYIGCNNKITKLLNSLTKNQK